MRSMKVKKVYSVIFRVVIVALVVGFVGNYIINNTNQTKYDKGKDTEEISLNGENYTPISFLKVTDKGRKIGYVLDDNNNPQYEVHEIKGLKSDEWVSVNYSSEPGVRGNWVCKKESVKLPSLSEFGVSKIKILSSKEYFSKKVIDNSEDVDRIMKAVANKTDEKANIEDVSKQVYELYFMSKQYPGIAYGASLVITKDKKYYYYFYPDNKYIEVTNEFKNFIK